MCLQTIQNKYREMKSEQIGTIQRLVHTVHHFAHNYVSHHNWDSSLTCYSNGNIKDVALFLWKSRDKIFHWKMSTTKHVGMNIGRRGM